MTLHDFVSSFCPSCVTFLTLRCMCKFESTPVKLKQTTLTFFCSYKLKSTSFKLLQLSTMVRGQPIKSQSKAGGNTVVWGQYGNDCAYVIWNLSVRDGFKSWGAFQKDSAYAGFLKRYTQENLKQNFDKTVKRYNGWKENGGGGFKKKLSAYLSCLFYPLTMILLPIQVS
jgi:hypothetical protein